MSKTLRVDHDKNGFMAWITEVIDIKSEPWGRTFRGDYKPTKEEAIESANAVYEKYKETEFLPVSAE